MFTVYIVAVHVAGLALAVAGVIRAGDRPQALVYAFILDYGLRLATVFAVTRALAAREDSLLLRVAPFICRLPTVGAESQPIRYEGSRQAAGPGAYFFTVLFLAFLAFVLGNVNADRELELDAVRFEQDLRWASGLALLYWMQSLLARTTVIDTKARWEVNVGYNTRELTILAVSILVAGLVVAVRQANGLPESGWTVLGPLFAFRFLFDLWSALPPAAAIDASRSSSSDSPQWTPRTQRKI